MYTFDDTPAAPAPVPESTPPWTAVRTMATSPVTRLTTVAGVELEGVTLALDDRVLLVAQTDPAENGLYVIMDDEKPDRATDATDRSAFTKGRLVNVTAGPFAGSTYVFAGLGPDEFLLETTPLRFYRKEATPLALAASAPFDNTPAVPAALA